MPFAMKSNLNILNREQKYTAPVVKELYLLNEGVLCASQNPEMTLGVDDWVRENGSLEF